MYRVLDRKRSPLSLEIRALISARISQINGRSFCVEINSSMVLKQGGSREKLDDLGHFQKSRPFTYSDRKVTDELFHMLKGR